MEKTRLLDYYEFNESVLDEVSEVADHLRNIELDNLSSILPPVKKVTWREDKHPISLVDIQPKDYKDVLVYHLPMGNDLNDNMRFFVMTLQLLLPDYRIIASGNLAEPGQNSAKLTLNDIGRIYQGNLRPLAEPTLTYLSSQGITSSIQIGYSFGSEKAVTIADYAYYYDQQISRLVVLEPVTVAKRTFLRLIQDFKSSEELMEHYIKASDCMAYDLAREQTTIMGKGPLGYIAGLARLGNLAIESQLKKDSLNNRLGLALVNNKNLKLRGGWGSDSLLSINDILVKIFDDLEMSHNNSIERIILPGHTHAMSEDIFLLSTLIMQSLVS